MHGSVMHWVSFMLPPAEIRRARVLEVGSLYVNGSVRDMIMAAEPASYTGADIRPGQGVDVICFAAALARRFGTGSMDIVVCTETLEHVVDWQASMAGIISVLAPGGWLVLTTRSPGFGWHPHPVDTWRYTTEAVRQILELAGLEIPAIRDDPDAPGVLALARKPDNWAWPDSIFGLWDKVAGVTVMEPPDDWQTPVVHVGDGG